MFTNVMFYVGWAVLALVPLMVAQLLLRKL